MSVMIQIRNVPEGVHRTLKARAAMRGLTLSDLCLAELRQAANRPTIEEIRRRTARWPRLPGDGGAAKIVRDGRDLSR